TFDVQGMWIGPSVLLYANGIPSRMRDGLVWILPRDTRKEFSDWLSKVEWPTTETLSRAVALPGRWLEEEEAARFWLHLQGVPVSISPEEVLVELEQRGLRLSRFSEHIPSEVPDG